MNSEQLVPALMFMTLGAVLVFGVIQLIALMRKRRERENSELSRHSERLRAQGQGTSFNERGE